MNAELRVSKLDVELETVQAVCSKLKNLGWTVHYSITGDA